MTNVQNNISASSLYRKALSKKCVHVMSMSLKHAELHYLSETGSKKGRTKGQLLLKSKAINSGSKDA